MKTAEFDSLGLKWPLNVPDTTSEFDIMAGRPGACLEAAIRQIVYHNTLGDIRTTFCEVLDAHLKSLVPPVEVPWESGKKDAEGADVLLNEGAWINKVLALTGKTISEFAFLQPAVLNGDIDTSVTPPVVRRAPVNFDPSTSERKSGPPKVSKASLTAANSLITKLGDNVAALTKKLEALNPECKKAEFGEDGKVKPESLARLISANEARKRAEVKLEDVYSSL